MIMAEKVKNESFSTFKKFFIKGTAGAFLLKVSSVLLWLVTYIALARWLGPHHFGVYAYIVSIINILCVPAALGLPEFIVREVASFRVKQQWGLIKGLLRRADQTVMISASCIILLGAGAAFTFLPQSEKTTAFYIALPLLIINPLVSVKQATLRGFRRIIFGLLPDSLLRPGLFLILLAAFYYSGTRCDEKSALAMLLLASSVCLVFGFFVVWRSTCDNGKDVSVQYQTSTWIKGALPFILLDSMMVISNQTDMVMLGIFRTPSEVGLYKVASQGAQMVIFILFAVNMTIGPLVSELYHSQRMQELQKLITSSSRVIVCISVPVAVALMIWGRPIITLLFGKEYALSSVPLVILCAGQLISAVMGSVGLILNMTGYEKDTLKGLVGSALINVLLNLLLIPRFGIEGAAVATSISVAFWNTLLGFYVYKKVGILTVPIKIKMSRVIVDENE